MTPGARIQAAIEILNNSIDQGFPPADEALKHYFKARRFIGSKDRRAIREQVFSALRHLAWLRWWAERLSLPQTAHSYLLIAQPVLQKLDAHTTSSIWQDGKYAPPALTQVETFALQTLASTDDPRAKMPEAVRYNIPEFMLPSLQEAFGNRLEEEMAALQQEAPTDIRINPLKTNRKTVLETLTNEGIDAIPIPEIPHGIRLHGRPMLHHLASFKNGWFEVQDAASQIAVQYTPLQPGMTVIDFCAGAGGKALAMAAHMQNRGIIHCWDTDTKRLSRIKERAARAGTKILHPQTLPENPADFLHNYQESADLVVVDAPCSGSGTWRRNPHLRWRYDKQNIDAFATLQRNILNHAAPLVRPGGTLAYFTCSLHPQENTRQIEYFLQNNQTFILPPNIPAGQRTPALHACDGFYMAFFIKNQGLPSSSSTSIKACQQAKNVK